MIALLTKGIIVPSAQVPVPAVAGVLAVEIALQSRSATAAVQSKSSEVAIKSRQIGIDNRQTMDIKRNTREVEIDRIH